MRIAFCTMRSHSAGCAYHCIAVSKAQLIAPLS